MRKRTLDVTVGAFMCLVALPVIVLSALIAMVSLRTTSPFFRHLRIGQHNRDLDFPKLRSLPTSTPMYALKTNMSFDDVPRVMRLIRELHLDELPQLFLVLTGKISLVGPRPRMPDAIEPVAAHFADARVTVPQGCTGLWQISEFKACLPGDAPEFDLFYVRHHTLRMDLWILWRTFAQAIRIRPLIASLDDIPRWTYDAPDVNEAIPSPPPLDLRQVRLIDLTESVSPRS